MGLKLTQKTLRKIMDDLGIDYRYQNEVKQFIAEGEEDLLVRYYYSGARKENKGLVEPILQKIKEQYLLYKNGTGIIKELQGKKLATVNSKSGVSREGTRYDKDRLEILEIPYRHNKAFHVRPQMSYMERKLALNPIKKQYDTTSDSARQKIQLSKSQNNFLRKNDFSGIKEPALRAVVECLTPDFAQAILPYIKAKAEPHNDYPIELPDLLNPTRPRTGYEPVYAAAFAYISREAAKEILPYVQEIAGPAPVPPPKIELPQLSRLGKNSLSVNSNNQYYRKNWSGR